MDLFLCSTIRPGIANNNIGTMSAILYLHDFHELLVPFYPTLHQHQIRAARGARVLIHEAGTYPDINAGFDVAPGHDVVLDLQLDRMERKHIPYGECTETKYLESTDKPWDGYRFKYTTQAAIAVCRQMYTLRECNCAHPNLPISPEIAYVMNESGALSCHTHVMNYPQCPINLTKMHEDIHCYHRLNLEKVCQDYLAPCHEQVYSFQLFQTPWPHESYELAFYEDEIKLEGNDSRGDKFGDLFAVYDNISDVMEDDRTEGMRLLRQEDLIERNFIQLTAKFKVSVNHILHIWFLTTKTLWMNN